MCEMDAALREFLIESQENLERLDHDLIAVEQDPARGDAVGDIFRVFHTIKGTCGFFDFPRLEHTSHVGESLLGELHEGRIAWSPVVTEALLELVQTIRGRLDAIERTGRDPEGDDGALLERLEALRALATLPSAAPRVAELPDDVPADEWPFKPALSIVVADDEPHAARPGEATIRVDIGQLDTLMNLVGELVLARNRLSRLAAGGKSTPIQEAVQRLSAIASELQDGVMRTRMQPIGNLWSRFPRLVRDLSLQCRKGVSIEMTGESTGLDKAILEAIKDPLTHLIRNAIDHGIEDAETRRAAGKAAAGKVSLRAYHEGGLVHVEVSDDGGGIDPAKIRSKALERGLITAEQAARLDDRDLFRLIFLPGFSTARAVTSISGRGVGMDVVKTNVERIGGAVDVQSELGVGTTFQVKIPLTLAIIPALIVVCGGDRYAIPQVSLLELVRLEGDDVRAHIEWIGGVPIYRLRGELVPLVDLDRALGLEPVAPREDLSMSIVVLHAENRRYGLIVQAIIDTEEIVVKPLTRQLKQLSVYSGTTIMGDGRVALILDVQGIAQHVGIIGRGIDAGRATPDAGAAAVEPYLVVATEDGRRLAMPLAVVSRLEVFDSSVVESTRDHLLVQYRGDLLPLVHLIQRPAAPAATGPIRVVVTSDGGRTVGLVVDRIVDIVSEPVHVRDLGLEEGGELVGTAVLQRRATDLLDVPALIRRRFAAARGA